MNILVRSVIAALGDVLYVTPITARLRRDHPNAKIVVHTRYPNVFEDNPHVNETNTHHSWDLFINLDLAHAVRRHLNAVDAYMEAAFGDHGDLETDKSIVFTYPPWPEKLEKTVAIHPNKSWENRTMPNNWWDEVVQGLIKASYSIVVLGTNIDYCPPNTTDTRNRLNLKGQASLIAACDALVCGPSGLFILAAATETPIIVPMTINTPETCVMWRHGILGWRYYPIEAKVPCLGCNSFAEPGATFVGCQSPHKPADLLDYACIGTIKAEEAIELTLTAIKEHKQ